MIIMSEIASNKREGFLVIRRINYFSDNRYSTKESKPSIKKDCDEILKNYKGIEGEAWPLDTNMLDKYMVRGLASLEMNEEIVAYHNEAAKKYLCDLLYISTDSTLNLIDNLSDKFSYCGIDYGLYTSEYNNYSVIFNEVIYGQYEEMREFAKFLNDDLLLPSVEVIKEICKIRKMLVLSGADLETCEQGEKFGPIFVFKIK